MLGACMSSLVLHRGSMALQGVGLLMVSFGKDFILVGVLLWCSTIPCIGFEAVLASYMALEL
jgi:hypothetical protein